MSDTPKVDAPQGDVEPAQQPSPGPTQAAPPTTEFPAGSGATPRAGQATPAPGYRTTVPPLGDPFAASSPSNQAGAFGGAIPEDRPELLLAASLAGGVFAAIVLRTLVRR